LILVLRHSIENRSVTRVLERSSTDTKG